MINISKNINMKLTEKMKHTGYLLFNNVIKQGQNTEMFKRPSLANTTNNISHVLKMHARVCKT